MIQTALRWMIAFTTTCLPAALVLAADGPNPETQTIEVRGTVVKFTMVKIPAGSIELNIPGTPARKVDIKSFWIGQTEVTWDEFDTWAYGLDITDEKEKIESVGKTRPSKPYGSPDFGFGHSGYPVLAATCFSAEMYCKWLSEKTGKKFRLPTEAEWEYACRAGGPPLSFDNKEELEKLAWFDENSEEKTQPVKQKQPNAFGLYDMLGNVLEWVIKDEAALKADEEFDRKKAEEGTESKRAQTPLARGGSWKDPIEKVNSSQRFYQTPAWNISDPQDPKSRWWLADGKFIGFRVVCEE